MPQDQSPQTPPAQQITNNINKQNVYSFFSNKKKLIFLFLGLIFFLLATSALILRKSQTEPSQPLSSQLEVTPTPKPSSSLVNNNIPKNWKTYTNKAFKFSINYPNGWKIEETIVNPPEGQDTQFFLSIDDDNNSGYLFIIVTTVNSWNKSVQSGGDEYQENGIFNGLPAMMSIRETQDARPNDSIIIKSPVSGHFFSLIYDYHTNNKKELIEQILSTFKFLD